MVFDDVGNTRGVLVKHAVRESLTAVWICLLHTPGISWHLTLPGTQENPSRGPQRMRGLDGITDSMDMSLRELRDGQGGLVWCSPWGHKELDTNEWLN